MDLLKSGRRLESPYSGQRYEITAKLGEGGFGQAYRGYAITRSGQPQEEVCIKVIQDQGSWHTEYYFGNLLRGNPRVIQIKESFPLEGRVGGIKTTLYYLVSEFAEYGTIHDYLQHTKNEPWPAALAKREVLALLKVLNSLHGGGVTHRDLTPLNIFVTEGPKLKLGDFGIAAQTLAGTKPTVTTFNPHFVTQGFDGTPPDDVYQMGQLFAALLVGRAQLPLSLAEARKSLHCDEAIKDVVLRAIGPKNARYVDAYEMAQALKGETDTFSKLKSLKEKTVVFTGPLSIRREDAAILVFQAGGKLGREVNLRTDVLVIGGRGNFRGGSNKGVKLRSAIKVNKRHPNKITLIGEPDFRRLVRIRPS